jgi:hypothetical protein
MKVIWIRRRAAHTDHYEILPWSTLSRSGQGVHPASHDESTGPVRIGGIHPAHWRHMFYRTVNWPLVPDLMAITMISFPKLAEPLRDVLQ